MTLLLRRFVRHAVQVLVLLVLLLVVVRDRAKAQFVGMGYGPYLYGYPGVAAYYGFGYPGFGYMGYGFPGYGYGYGGFGFPAYGFGYGYGGFGYGFGYPAFGYGGFPYSPYGYWGYGIPGSYGTVSPASLSLGITPLAIQSAIMERGLRTPAVRGPSVLPPALYKIEVKPLRNPTDAKQEETPKKSNP